MFENNSADNTDIQVKNLSEKTKLIINEYDRILVKGSEIVPRLYYSLVQNDGFSPQDAFKFIKDKVDLSARRLRDLVPKEAKQLQEHVKSRPENVTNHTKVEQPSAFSKPNQAQLQSGKTAEEIVKEHPPEQPIIESEPGEITITHHDKNVIATSGSAVLKPPTPEPNLFHELKPEQVSIGYESRQLIVPNKTLNTPAFTKALGWARSNGDDLKFKADSEGVLSLV